MPFATLPSSSGFTPPQAPNWTGFASQAIDLLAHRPILNLSGAINQAVSQIDNILQLSSPQAKMERALHMMQLQAMQHTYMDYEQHPDKYRMTPQGPMLINQVEQSLKVAQLNKVIDDMKRNYTNDPINNALKEARTNVYNNKSTDPFDALRANAQPLFNSPDSMNHLPTRQVTPGMPAEGQPQSQHNSALPSDINVNDDTEASNDDVNPFNPFGTPEGTSDETG